MFIVLQVIVKLIYRGSYILSKRVGQTQCYGKGYIA